MSEKPDETGAPEPGEKPDETDVEKSEKSEATPKSLWSRYGCLAWVALIVVGFWACTSIGGSGARNDGYDEQAICRDLVRDRLSDPSSARFTEQRQGPTFAEGIVEAKNRMGGTVRMDYECSSDGTTVRLVRLEER